MPETYGAKIVHASWLPDLIVPEEMGTPRPDQLQGTLHERVCELAGRICYDSLGKGRSSEEYHKHIKEVKHYSTIEHVRFKYNIVLSKYELFDIMRRKGIYVSKIEKWDETDFVATLVINPRSITDWDKFPVLTIGWYNEKENKHVKNLLMHLLHQSIPQIIDKSDREISIKGNRLLDMGDNIHEAYMTVYMAGSRGFSHEQVRHRYSMSQRSTRYVEEHNTSWMLHPLINKYCEDATKSVISHTIEQSRNDYRLISSIIKTHLVNIGVSPVTARKQALGAARGILGNALRTEMLFTATVAEWQDMFLQRMNPAADAEIRLIYNRLYENIAISDNETTKSMFQPFFDQFTFETPEDGIGFVLVPR